MRGKSPFESACEHLGLDFSESKDYIKQQQIMSTKKTFKIKLDAEFELDFDGYGFSDAQKTKEEDFKRMIIREYLDACGFDEFEVTGGSNISLLEVMADMFKPNKK